VADGAGCSAGDNHQKESGMSIQLKPGSQTSILVKVESIRHVIPDGEGCHLCLSGPNIVGLLVRESYAEVKQKLRECRAIRVSF
jgi:hypothetical protein